MWLGGGYTYEKFSVSLAYQEWMYADDSERIVDLSFAYDTFLKPTPRASTAASRASTGRRRRRGLLGVSHAIEARPWTIKFPLNVAFVTKNYYQDDEGGFGYASVGSVMSVPIVVHSRKVTARGPTTWPRLLLPHGHDEHRQHARTTS